MIGKGRLIRVLSGIALAVGLAFAPVTASAAEPVAVQGCQGSGAALYYYYVKSDGTTGLWSKTCSGTYPLNSLGLLLDAGGWSGTVTFSTGSKVYFCDWEVWDLGRNRVVQIFMSATRASWC